MRKITKFASGVFAAVLLIAASPAALAALPVDELVPMGKAVGISIKTDGVIVAAVGEVETSTGKKVTPAADAGLLPGDVITKINNLDVTSAAQLKTEIDKLDGSDITLRVIRQEKSVQITLTPHVNDSGGCELGIILRDSMTGIGTMTFYDPESGMFAALGHAVNDVDTGILIPVKQGGIMDATITDIVRGEVGAPGQLHGIFNAAESIGDIDQNTTRGIYGTIDDSDFSEGMHTIPVAEEKEIRTGTATILSTTDDGNVHEYEIEITRIYNDKDRDGRTIMLEVTDPELLEKTGGIVQGMSGSPIIQNGKLIGAVTHVLINDPTKGYGLSLEKMLEIGYNSYSESAA